MGLLTASQLSAPNTPAQAAALYGNGMPVSLLNSMIHAESSGNPNAVSYTGVQGMAQITQGTWNQEFPGVPYSTDPQQQLNAGAAILGSYYHKYGGNQALVATAYNGGPAVANLAQQYVNQGVDSYTAIVMANQNYVGRDGSTISPQKQNETNNYAHKVVNGSLQGAGGSSTGSDGAATFSADNGGVNDSSAVAAVPVYGSTQAVTQSDLTPPLVISAGLDETPWFSDPTIVPVNRPTHNVPCPVTFAIYFDLNSSPLPVSIRLNASLATVTRDLHHISNKRPTRTGFLLTLWGMQPDTLTGSGTTGLFMNQLGITDFYSMTNAPSSVKQAVLHAFKSSNMAYVGRLAADMGEEGFFRVAAKDAFIEFLSTFKNNGIVWFQNPSYTGYTTAQSNNLQGTTVSSTTPQGTTTLMQIGANAWSPQTGSSSFQNQGRRNDVMTRGGVAMYYRNSVYYGYFQNFSWTENAEKPFQWDFTFTFKVERTVSILSLPALS